MITLLISVVVMVVAAWAGPLTRETPLCAWTGIALWCAARLATSPAWRREAKAARVYVTYCWPVTAVVSGIAVYERLDRAPVQGELLNVQMAAAAVATFAGATLAMALFLAWSVRLVVERLRPSSETAAGSLAALFGHQLVPAACAWFVWTASPWLPLQVWTVGIATVFAILVCGDGAAALPPERGWRRLIVGLAVAVNIAALVRTVIDGYESALDALITWPGPLLVQLITGAAVVSAALVFLAMMTDLPWKVRPINMAARKWLERLPDRPWSWLMAWRHLRHRLNASSLARVLGAGTRAAWETGVGRLPYLMRRRVELDRVGWFLAESSRRAAADVAKARREWRAQFGLDRPSAERMLGIALRRQSAALLRQSDYEYCPIERCPSRHGASAERLWSVMTALGLNVQWSLRLGLSQDPGQRHALKAARIAWLVKWRRDHGADEGPVLDLLVACAANHAMDDRRAGTRDAVVRWIASPQDAELETIVDLILGDFSLANDAGGLVACAQQLGAGGIVLTSDQHLEVAEAWIRHASEVSPDGSGDLATWVLEQARGHSYRARSRRHLEVVSAR